MKSVILPISSSGYDMTTSHRSVDLKHSWKMHR